MKIKILSIEYHRNGVMGNPFYVVLFKHEGTTKVATVFEEQGSVAVLDVGLLAEGVIEYPNRWRGDDFERELREAIELQCLAEQDA